MNQLLKAIRMVCTYILSTTFPQLVNSCSADYFDKVSNQTHCSPSSPCVSTLKDSKSSKGRISGTPSTKPRAILANCPNILSLVSTLVVQEELPFFKVQRTRPNISSEVLHITIGYLYCFGVSTRSWIRFLH